MILTVSAAGRGGPPAPSLAWFRGLARTAERGGLDAILLDGQWGPDARFTLDPMPLVAALAEATSRIGLAGALALDLAQPFNIARTFAALDRLTAGRSALIAAVGAGHHARAAECLTVVRKLWDSWEDGAILIDKPAGRFSDPDRVHPIDHRGEFFTVRGPLNAPRPLQGNPPVILRDGSAEGLALARETADLFVATDPSSLAAVRSALGARPRLLLRVPAPVSAERLAELSPSCDGFEVAPAVLPHDLDVLVDETVPRLRALGLRPATYDGRTLREHLGLARPLSQFAA